MESAYGIFTQRLANWYDKGLEMLPNIVLALAVVTVTIVLSRLLYGITFKVLGKVVKSQAVRKLCAFSTTMLMVLAGLFLSLSVLNLDQAVTSLLAGAGVAGLVLGLAFQEPITNVMSGVIVAFRKAYHIDDIVETNGYLGKVKEMSLRDTTITTFDGKEVIMPNKVIVQNPLVNYSAEEHRRIEITCGVAYNSDLTLVKSVVKHALGDLRCLSKDKPVQVIFTDFGASSINFEVRYWVRNSKMFDILEAKSKGIMSIVRAFRHEGIEIPFPRRTLDVNLNGESDMAKLSEMLLSAS